MYNIYVSQLIAWSLAAIFAASALVHLAGPGFIRRAYERWDFPPKFYRVAGVIELVTAVFMAEPITRAWGVALAALTMFVAIVTLLNNRQYAYTVPGILVLIALVPASLSAMAF
jgi:DoxX-like family